MGLHELRLRNFRSFDEFNFSPDPDAITVFLSPNGTGKTSVLEAVNALATAGSFRAHAASDMIRTNEDVAEVHGTLFHQRRRVTIDLTLTRGPRTTTKRMLVNGQRPLARTELAEALPITVFTPEGVDVVRQGPEHRRHFLTTLMTDVDPPSSETVERFSRLLSQRNALLRAMQGSSPSASQRDELHVWSLDLAVAGERLVALREGVLRELEPLVRTYYRDLAQNDQLVGLAYEQSWSHHLVDAIARRLEHDRHRGYTSVGPHRDDVALTLDARDARRQASQGEQRSLALALRLAGHELVQRRRGVDPLLLLDDVFSELDPARSDRLLQLLPLGQTLVTTASPLPSGMRPAVTINLAAPK